MGRTGSRQQQQQQRRGDYEGLPTTSSSSSAALVSNPGGGAGGFGSSAQAQALRLLTAPGALVLYMARAILYVITLRGLINAVAGSGGGVDGMSNSEGRWGTATGRGAGGDAGDWADSTTGEATEAPGGAAAEPGEWEGNPPVGVPAGKRISPLADRGVLLLLVLLHNRVR